jgi:hypothetical protein
MKTLKDILELYQAKSKDERRFVDKHIVVKQKDLNGNKDDVFQATNIKTIGRKAERHGYEPGEDEKVYEETEVLDEKITASTPTSDVISDFVHSKNPKFKGKTKAMRIKMALGASYAAKRGE